MIRMIGTLAPAAQAALGMIFMPAIVQEALKPLKKTFVFFVAGLVPLAVGLWVLSGRYAFFPRTQAALAGSLLFGAMVLELFARAHYINELIFTFYQTMWPYVWRQIKLHLLTLFFGALCFGLGFLGMLFVQQAALASDWTAAVSGVVFLVSSFIVLALWLLPLRCFGIILILSGRGVRESLLFGFDATWHFWPFPLLASLQLLVLPYLPFYFFNAHLITALTSLCGNSDLAAYMAYVIWLMVMFFCRLLYLGVVQRYFTRAGIIFSSRRW